MAKSAKVTALKDHKSKLDKKVKDVKKKTKLVSQDISKLENPLAILKKQLDMVLELLPLAEEAYRNKQYESNAKALNSLIEQSNDLMQQVQSIESADVYSNLITNILDPMIEAFIRNLTLNLNALKSDLKEFVNTKYTNRIDNIVKDCLISYGETGKNIYNQVKKDIQISLEPKK